MCGRATLTCPVEEIASHLGVEAASVAALAPQPRFNIAPGQPLLVARAPHAVDVAPTERFELALVRWGLVPAWARSPKVANQLVQARCESVETAPAFRNAFRRQRCLVVVDGFFEWKTLPSGAETEAKPRARGHRPARQPFYVHRPGREPFALAGVWERAFGPEGEVLETCAVVTTEAKEAIAELHDRMPLVLAPSEYESWVRGSPEHAHELIARTPDSQVARAHELVIAPVSTWVNDARHDDPRCLEPPPPSLASAGDQQIALPFTRSAG